MHHVQLHDQFQFQKQNNPPWQLYKHKFIYYFYSIIIIIRPINNLQWDSIRLIKWHSGSIVSVASQNIEES